MNVLITGGTGLIGRALTRSLLESRHKVWILTRDPDRAVVPLGVTTVGWDGRSAQGWGGLVNEMDAIVNVAGYNLSSWPWSEARKQIFWNSRVYAGQAIVEAVQHATHRPSVLIQASGVNYYGTTGAPADETASPGNDFLSRLAVAWEFSSQPVEDMGVRRVVVRNAVLISRENIIMKLMELPVRLFVGGRLGDGKQNLPWIHPVDYISALRFLIDHETARGNFNLVSPQAATNAEFTRALSKTLRRPYWFHVPAFLMRLVLGEMAVTVLEGRQIVPKRLQEAGFQFKYPVLEYAFNDLYRK